MQGKREWSELRSFEVERVDFLGADVAGEKRTVIGRDTGPGTAAELSAEGFQVSQVNDSIQLQIAEAKPVIAVIVAKESVKVHSGTVTRPRDIAKAIRFGRDLLPFLGLRV